MSRSARAGLTFLIFLVGSAAPARADWLLIPFVGSTFAGKSPFVFGTDAVGGKHWLFGGSAAWLTSHVLGLELDVAGVPNIFESDDPANIILVEASHAVTMSGNVIAAVPLSITGDSLRPYLVGGLGLARFSVRDRAGIGEPDHSETALQVGGGAIGYVSDRAGVRFDLRQISTLRRGDSLLGERIPRLSFWRATVGVVIRYR